MDLEREFRLLDRFYRENSFDLIINHELGIYFLKIRSISRAEILRKLAKRMKIDFSRISGKNLFRLIFCSKIPDDELDGFINQIFKKERQKRMRNEDYIYRQLYKLKIFDWGGFHQNAVERTIVNNYVKKIQDYEELCESIVNDINPRLRGYILCSWYNHWTSILIEDMFKDHTNILPAVGRVKKVDFFWHDFPFDLKVTYFPDGYMTKKRKELGLRPELTEMKMFARRNNISYDRNARDREISSELLARISEDVSKPAEEFMEKLHRIRNKIILNTIQNPTDLARWFYENQGSRRFDAASRFFLVLIDLRNLEDSWKLKRNKKLLRKEISGFLDRNTEIDFQKLKLSFKWENRIYTTYSTILFVLRS